MAAPKKGRPANLTLEVSSVTRPHSNTIIELETPIEYPSSELDDELLPQYLAWARMPQSQISLMRGFIELISLYKIAWRALRKVYVLHKT